MGTHCIILFGSPGAGKDELGLELAARLGFLHIPTGDLCRSPEFLKSLNLEQEAEAADKGGLANDKAILKMVKVALSNVPDVVLNGCPRSGVQAEALPVLLRELGYEHLTFVHLDGARDVCRKRLIDAAGKDPRRAGRRDNPVEVIDNRLTLYKKYGPEVLVVMKRHIDIHHVRIDAHMTIPEIHAEVLGYLGRLLNLCQAA